MRTCQLLLLSTTAAIAADRDLLALIPPESSQVFGVHVDRIAQLPSWPFLLGWADPNRNYFRDVTARSAIDLRRDLREVVMCKTGIGQVVILRGTFDTERAYLLDGSGEERRPETYEGTRVFVPAPPEEAEVARAPWTAVLPELLVIGPKVAVKAAIDRYKSPSSPGGGMVTAAGSAHDRFDAWAIIKSLSLSPFTDHAGEEPAQPAPQFETAALGLRLGQSVTASGEALAASALEAERLRALILAAIAFGRTQSSPPSLVTQIDRLQLSMSDRLISTSLTMRLEEFEQILIELK